MHRNVSPATDRHRTAKLAGWRGTAQWCLGSNLYDDEPATRCRAQLSTLWRCRATGNLTSRLSAALERLMLTRDLSAAMRQGEWRLAQFEERMCG